MNIDLRPLLPSDQPFLWEMLYQALYVAPGSPPFVRAILDDPDIACYLKGWGRPGDWGLLAVQALRWPAPFGCGNGRIGRIRMKEAMLCQPAHPGSFDRAAAGISRLGLGDAYAQSGDYHGAATLSWTVFERGRKQPGPPAVRAAGIPPGGPGNGFPGDAAGMEHQNA